MSWRRILFLFSTIALLGFAWVRWGLPRAELAAKHRLEAFLPKIIGHTVRIDTVHLHPLLLSASLEKVQVSNEERVGSMLFSCDRWLVKLIPFSLSRSFPWIIPTLGSSEITKPTVDLTTFRSQPRAASGFGSVLQPFWLRHRINWTGGTLQPPVYGQFPSVPLQDVMGEVQLVPDGLRLEARARSSFGLFHLTGRLAVPGRWEMTADITDIPLADLAAMRTEEAGRWTGTASMRAKIQNQPSKNNVSQSSIVWNLRGNVTNALWSGGLVPIPFSGSFELDSENLRVSDLRLFKDIKVAGIWSQPLTRDGKLDFEVSGSDISLTRMQKTLPPEWRRLAIKGRGSLKGKISGPLKAPVVDLRAEMQDVSGAGLAIPKLEAVLRRGADGLESEISLLDGKIVVKHGALSRSGRRETPIWKMRMSRIDLSEFLPANKWGTIGGRLSGQCRITADARNQPSSASDSLDSGPRPEVLFDGTLHLDDFKWGLHQETNPIVSHFSYADGHFRAYGQENDFRADIRHADEKTNISELSFRLPSGLVFAASGTVEGPDQRLAMAVSLSGVPVRDLPFLLHRYPEIGGTFDFEGQLAGTSSSPVFEGKLAVSRFQAREGGLTRDAQLSVHWDPDDRSLASFRVGEEWNGEVQWDSKRVRAVRMNAKDAEMQFLSDVVRGGEIWEGRLNGQVELESDKVSRKLNGKAELAWDSGVLGALVFDRASGSFQWINGTVHIKEWEVRQTSGSWQARGEFGASSWSLQSQFKAFSVANLKFDGEANLTGTAAGYPLAIKGKLNSPAFWINGYGIGSADADLAFRRSRLDITRARLGDSVSGETRIDFRTKSITGRWDIRAASLSEWGPRFGLRHPTMLSGLFDATARLGGNLFSPTIDFSTSWRGAQWKTTNFDASIAGKYSSGAIRVDTARLEASGGGVIEGKGTLFWPPAARDTKTNPTGPEIDLSLDLRDLRASQTFGLLGFGAEARGAYGGTVRGTGTWLHPVWTGTLSGPELSLGRVRVGEWSADLRYENREINIDRLFAKTSEGTWSMRNGSRLFITGPQEGHLQLINDLRNVHLGPLSFFGGLEIVGQRRADAGALGEFNLRAQSLWVNQYRFDHDLARVVVGRDKIVFNPAQGSFQQVAGEVLFDQWPQVRLVNLTLREGKKKRLEIDGEVGPEKWDFRLEGWDLDAQTLLSLADWNVPMDGKLDVRLKAQGSPNHPDVRGNISGRSGTLAGVPYDRFQTNIAWKGPMLEIRALEAVRKDGYVVRGQGRLPTGSEGSELEDLSLHLRLTNGNLKLLKDIWSDCRSARGEFRGELQILPGKDGPRMSGFLVVDKGIIKAQRYFRDLKDLKARLLLQDKRLVFENLSGRVGDGRLIVKGDVGLNGFDITEYNLSVESVGSRGARLEAPQLSMPPGPLLKRFSLLRKSLEGISEGQPLVYLTITGPDGQQTVKGTVVLEDTQFTYPPPSKIRSTLPPDSWLRQFYRDARWDLVFRTGESTWYRNEFVNVRLKGSLHLYGQAGSMRGDGRVESRQGVITYLGQTFRVKRTSFEVVTDTRTALENTYSVIPYLAGEAERVAPTMDPRGFSSPDTVLMVIDRAPIGEIQPRFISRNNPGLASERVAQMALGLSAEDLTPDEKDKLLRAGLVQLLGSTAGPLASRIAHRFGIDILYPIYEPNEPDYVQPGQRVSQSKQDTQSLLRGAGASAGMQLTDRVFGLYKFKVDETQNQQYFRDEVELIYRVTGNLHLRASTELDSEKLLGQPPNRQAILENQWRFGLPARKMTEEKKLTSTPK